MSRARRTIVALLVASAVLGVLGSVAGAQDTTATIASTEAPATTQAPATTAAPATTVAPSASDNDSDNWLLILVGVVIVLGIVVFFVGRARTQKGNANWRQQASTLLDELSDVGISLAAAQPSAIPVLASRAEGRLVQLNAQLATLHHTGPSALERNALVPVINASNTFHATLTQITLALPGGQSSAAANVANDGALLDSTARSAKLSLLGAGRPA